jgi:hypothetical protein
MCEERSHQWLTLLLPFFVILLVIETEYLKVSPVVSSCAGAF